MFPEWISRHFLLMMLLTGTIFTFCWLYAHRELLKLKWYTAVLIAVLHTTWGVFCVKVFAFAESGFDLKTVGNMSLFGGVFLMPAFYFCMAKLLRLKCAQVFDCCTICMIFTLMCARVNCLVSGCCFGWHIPGSRLRWPTREAELAYYVFFMIWIVKRLSSGRIKGEIYPIYMMSYGVFRFIDEFFRFYEAGTLMHPAHVWAAISFCIGIGIYMQLQSEEKASGRHSSGRNALRRR